jgi:hypothetical protein
MLSEAHIQTCKMSSVEVLIKQVFFPIRFYLHCVAPEYIPSTGKGTSSTLTDLALRPGPIQNSSENINLKCSWQDPSDG